MLRQLVIHDVVLIDRLELEFEAGLGALTGETGAGKSILLDSLGLALGIRADAGLVRAGQASASVSAEIELPPGHAAFAALDEQGISCEPGEPLLLRRTLKADGGSRAFAGGVAVPATLLRDIAASLVEIHGQHDDRGLLNPKGHRALLDAFGRLDIGAVEQTWVKRIAIETELAEQRQMLADADRDRDWLDFAIDEIGALNVEEGEEVQLADARSLMKAAARIEDDLGALGPHYAGSDGGLSQLRQAARRLERIHDAHPLLAEAL
ncbi:MAG TPA: AAA family ATPase, partial [Sphingomicrobium sp.]|nr:AAA family ATPase [Sphingomicrobium sp.]